MNPPRALPVRLELLDEFLRPGRRRKRPGGIALQPRRLAEVRAAFPTIVLPAGPFDDEPFEFQLPLDLRGTPFQRKVWNALLDIPYGETRSYAQLARSIGVPNAFRAVGAANGANPISIVIPCHRVISSGGGLGGYGGGLPLKRRLLALESGTCRSLFD